MAEQHEPGEKVQTSGIDSGVKEGDGGSGFEVTCVEGEPFPRTRSGKAAHNEWVHGATHSHQHSALGSGDKSIARACDDGGFDGGFNGGTMCGLRHRRDRSEAVRSADAGPARQRLPGK